VTDTRKLEWLAARIAKLTPADALRLCAELIESGRGEVAEPILRRLAVELSVAVARKAGRL